MATKTPAQLLTQANQIREETKLRANSATRVGAMLVDIIDTLYVPAVDASATGATNTAAIQAAINAAHTAGGGKVQIPAGVFSLDTAGGNVCLSLANKSNIWLCGSGVGATELYMIDAADSHMVNIDGTASNITISDMVLNGNRANQTVGVHGIRCVAVDGLWLDRLFVRECAAYGIGLQGATKRFLFLSNLKVANTGQDSIDSKNTDDDNAHMVATNITLEEFGLNGALTEQCGFDCRGPWQLSNITAKWSDLTGMGIRFREGELLDPNGLGGHESSLHGFYCEGPDIIANPTSLAMGFYSDARDCSVSGGTVKNMYRGVMLASGTRRNKIHAVTAASTLETGLYSHDSSQDNSFTDCNSEGGVGPGFRLGGTRTKASFPRVTNTATSSAGGILVPGTSVQISHPVIVGTDTGTDQGLIITGADVTVVGGDLSLCSRGLQTSGARTKVIGVAAHDNTDDGIRLSAGADDATVRDCYVTGNADEGLDILSDRVRVMGGEYTSNGGDGIQITSGADGTMVDGVYFSGNTGSALDDGGTNTRVGLLNVGAASPFMLNFPRFLSATGAPSQVAPIGSTYLRLDGTTTGVASGVFVSYVKEFGSGVATGWVGK